MLQIKINVQKGDENGRKSEEKKREKKRREETRKEKETGFEKMIGHDVT